MAHCSPNQIRLVEETARGWFLTNELLDLGPLIEKKTQIPHKVPCPLAFTDGPDNDSNAVGNLQFTHNLAQPFALLLVFNFPRDAAPIAKRHQHQVASGKTEIRSYPRPFVPDGTLGDLHNDIRADWIDTRYIFNRDPFSRPLASAAIDFLNPAVERSRNCIPKMKERIFLKADVDKHRLQPHLDVFDFTLINAADDIPRALTLDTVLLEPAILQHSHPGLELFHAEYELFAGLS